MASPLSFDTAANSKISVSTTAINLEEYFRGLDESSDIRTKANVWSIYVESGSIRIFSNGNIPTSTVGTPVVAGQYFSVNGASASEITMISGSSAVVTIEAGVGVQGFSEATRMGKVTLEAGDIQIGAVEIKDGTTDQRATVNTAGELLVSLEGQARSLGSSTAQEASRVDKNSAGTLYSVTGYNASTSPQFIQIHDAASLPADTAVPLNSFVADALSNFSWEEQSGQEMANGIVVCNSSTQPTKTIGSADCWFNVTFI